jgi:HEAT repeat protein
VDAASGRHVLRQVVAGWGVQRQGPLTREAADRRQEQRIRLREQMRERLAARSARQAEVPPEERARRRAEREASRARLKEAKPGAPSESDLLRDLESDDPRVRLDAVEQLVPDAASRIERLGQIALEDPDPAVRAAAAEQLGDSDAATAVQALLGALDDSEPSVVIAALSALEWIGDESITPRIQPLLAHRHPAGREAAAEAIRMLE